MAPLCTPAFILRTVDYGERHVIVHLLGRDTGRISAIAYNARSSRRRFSGALEPLRILEATLKPPRSGDLYGLEELEVVEDFKGIDERIETITAASYATELIRETWREGEEGQKVFELLRRFFHGLPSCPSNGAIYRLVYQFEFQLMSLYGLAPTIHHCARCGADPAEMDRLRFSRGGEGLICGACRHSGDALGVVTASTLALLHHLADPNSPLPTEDLAGAMAQSGRILANSIDHFVERPLLARQMLRSVVAIGE